MEATFYDESRFRPKEDLNKSHLLKRPMTLDLDSSKYSKKQKVTALLTSPDLNMLKLASPELERMIIAQHGVVTSTPTPSQCMYPKNVHDDRDYNSRDFGDALNNMHQTVTTTSSNMYMQDPVQMSCSAPSSCNNPMENNGYYQQQQPPPSSNCNSVMIPSTSSGPVTSGIGNCYNPMYYNMPMSNSSISIKEEPQTVPCMGVTPPLSPIDMENQERIKLERKRLRNRIAASKCRRRKLERIAKLEDKVAHLKSENSELTNVVNRLREQVCSLKQQVMDHVRCGCEILNIRPDLAQF